MSSFHSLTHSIGLFQYCEQILLNTIEIWKIRFILNCFWWNCEYLCFLVINEKFWEYHPLIQKTESFKLWSNNFFSSTISLRVQRKRQEMFLRYIQKKVTVILSQRTLNLLKTLQIAIWIPDDSATFNMHIYGFFVNIHQFFNFL